MTPFRSVKRISWVLIAPILLVSGCSLPFLGGSDVDLSKSTALPPLEVPPDLNTPTYDTSLAVPGEEINARAPTAPPLDDPLPVQKSTTPSPRVLPTFSKITQQKSGDVRWLEVEGSPARLWPSIEAFWEQRGVPLGRTDADVGIIETEWVARQEELPGPADETQAKRLQDKFRVRLERENDRVTSVFLTHEGADKTSDEDEAKWRSTGRNLELEAEVLNQLLAFLGGDEDDLLPSTAASQPDTSEAPVRLESFAGAPALIVNGMFSNIWSNTGKALVKTDIEVENADMERGIYFLNAKRGFLGRFFGKGKKLSGQYQLHLLDQGDRTLITAHTTGDGKLDNETAISLLERLQDELKKQKS